MEYKKICENCIHKSDCKPNFIYYTQSYTDLDITYTADVMKCKNYIPLKLVKINRKELINMAQNSYDIEQLVKRQIKKRSF